MLILKFWVNRLASTAGLTRTGKSMSPFKCAISSQICLFWIPAMPTSIPLMVIDVFVSFWTSWRTNSLATANTCF